MVKLRNVGNKLKMNLLCRLASPNLIEKISIIISILFIANDQISKIKLTKIFV